MLKLRELRKKCGLTLKELGTVIGVAESTISQYETGKRQPDYETLLKLGEYFGVSVDYLLGRETNAKEKAAGTSADGLSDYDSRVLSWFHSLPQEKREAILNLGDGPKK